MTYKALRRAEGITCIAMPIVLAATIIWGLWYLPLIALFGAIVMFAIIIYNMKEAYRDERTTAIDEKSGKATVNITSLGMLVAGSVLLAVNHDVSSNIGLAAIVIYAVAFGMGIISYLTKLYYKAKLGDK
jgi:uncharacterized membrane protein